MSKFSESLSNGMAKLLGMQGSKIDPLSDYKSLTRWIQNLPLGDAMKAHQELLAELKRFNENITELSGKRLQILMLMDEKAQDLQGTLTYQYLRNPRMARAVESHLWHAIYNMNWEVVRAYHTYTLGFSRSPVKSKLEQFMPLITLRALRGFRQLIKWRLFRYQQPSEKTWLRLHNLYVFAEAEGFHNKSLRAYPNDTAESTCEREYLHTLMLERSDSGSLYPRQIDLIDRWLDEWCKGMSLSATLHPELHVFSVDTSQDHGPKRIRNRGPEASTRYWSTIDLVANLKTIRARVKDGEPPARVGLTEDVRVSESLELIEQLERQWAPLSQREQRRKPRKTVKRVVEIVHGLDALVSHVKANGNDNAVQISGLADNMRYDEEADMRVYGFVTERTRQRTAYAGRPLSRMLDTERWVMEDESEIGYGTTIETSNKDWLRVGGLVGVKADKDEAWSVGIVRRMTRFGDFQSSVGIETLLEKPILVMLYGKRLPAYEVNGVDTNPADLPVAGLLLPAAEGSLLIDPAEYSHKREFEYTYLDETHVIQLDEMLERGEGWILVSYSALN